ncbi:MAG: acetyl-CoA carboxylase biotin carboxyl carrier protein [Phycisphaerae bacterium]
MELEQIRELIGLMKENDLTEVRINEGEKRLLLKRGSSEPVQVMTVSPAAPPAMMPTTAGQTAAPKAVPEPESVTTINSPMVGTLYAAPAPDAESFVRVGDHVHSDTVVCIIEAMKVMNEIKAEMAGTIERILAKNADPVEFGQPLFQIKPD